uniref:Omega-Theraphotoxin-Sfo2a_1 n=1 Tax=Selenotholus foelschei TaxID=1905327 RepID=A0A482Z6L4_9ARAC
MKVSVVLAIGGLVLLSFACASALKENELMKKVARELVIDNEDAAQHEERAECRWYLGGCTKDSDCCKHLQCHSKHEWCLWDGTFSK